MDENLMNTEETVVEITEAAATNGTNTKLLVVGGAVVLVTGLVVANRKRIKEWWHNRKVTSEIVDGVMEIYDDSEVSTEK